MRVLFTILMMSVATVTAAAELPPNIILVLADDLGAKELSCYGSRDHHTPNLDRMAAEGVRFETFFSMPLCTPTRVCLMTGQYGFNNGFLGMQNPAFKPLKSSPQADIGNHFTHADLVKTQGYVTAQAGKWQLSGELPTLIHDAGFDEYRMWAYDHNLPPGIVHPAHEKGGNASRYWHPSIVENGRYRPTTAHDYGPDQFNQFVIEFAARNKSKPFFVYYTAVQTHSPHLETPDPLQPGKRNPASFKSNLEYLDHLMGRLLQSLKDEGIDDRTVVIFIGDNGTGGDGKGTLTELGARVPCIIRGPGIQRGFVSRAVADLTDIMPTIAALSGATLPANVSFDGHSLVPVLRGEQASHRDWIYSHLDDGRILRDQRWLLEIDKGGKQERFFDCGERRDGVGYKNVTQSDDPAAKSARARFQEILATIPLPQPHPNVDDKAAASTKPASDQRNRRFKQRDLNQDGRLDPSEFTQTAIAKDVAANDKRFKKLDRNGDRQVSLDEFLSE